MQITREIILPHFLRSLDSEQNNKFADHYVEPSDRPSEVLFIATANDIQNIPRPLLDRMEVIEISSYTENEKFHIAKEHLVPKQKKANGLKEAQLVIEDEALMEVISGYTREAGVRPERQIGRICRKSARKILEEQVKEVAVTKENLEEFLGKERYGVPAGQRKPEIGIVRGPYLDGSRRRYAADRGQCDAGKGEFLADRPAWRWDEGVRAGGHQLYSVPWQSSMRFRKNFRETRHPHSYSGGSRSKRWPVCRYYDGDGDGFRDHKGSGKSRRCDDRRDYAPRSLPDRRL